MEMDIFTPEIVSRASKACGPLVEWVLSHVRISVVLLHVQPIIREQVSYAEILERVQPLQAEVRDLQTSIGLLGTKCAGHAPCGN